MWGPPWLVCWMHVAGGLISDRQSALYLITRWIKGERALAVHVDGCDDVIYQVRLDGGSWKV